MSIGIRSRSSSFSSRSPTTTAATITTTSNNQATTKRQTQLTLTKCTISRKPILARTVEGSNVIDTVSMFLTIMAVIDCTFIYI
jgi:hypothetical protein